MCVRTYVQYVHTYVCTLYLDMTPYWHWCTKPLLALVYRPLTGTGVQTPYWHWCTEPLLALVYRALTGTGVQTSYWHWCTEPLLALVYRALTGTGVQTLYWHWCTDPLLALHGVHTYSIYIHTYVLALLYMCTLHLHSFRSL